MSPEAHLKRPSEARQVVLAGSMVVVVAVVDVVDVDVRDDAQFASALLIGNVFKFDGDGHTSRKLSFSSYHGALVAMVFTKHP